MRLVHLIFAFGILVAVGLAEPPPNDDVMGAAKMFGASGQIVSNNIGATYETPMDEADRDPESESRFCGSYMLTTVWYSWQAPTDGNITIDTIGSDLDTVVGVFSGTGRFPYYGSDHAICDDDSGGSGDSRLLFEAEGGVIYRICIMGFGGTEGEFVLNWNMDAAPPLPDPPSGLSGAPALAYSINEVSTSSGHVVKYIYRWTSNNGDEVTHGPTVLTYDVLREMDLVEEGETWTVTVTPMSQGVGGPSSQATFEIQSVGNGIAQWKMYK